MFYCNIFIAVILYGLIFAIAPFVADFYDLPLIKNVLRAIGLILITKIYYNFSLEKKLLL